MHADELAIRNLIQTWIEATAEGNLEQILALMSDDIIFLTPGQKPFGKKEFAAASKASQGKVQISPTSEVREVTLAGDMACAWSRLEITLRFTPEGDPKRLSGHTLSVFRKQANGKWLLARDANLVTPEPRRQGLQAAVAVFQVASVASSIRWYQDILGFSANPVGPSGDPVFAILRRDGVELMLQKGGESAVAARSGQPELCFHLYLRVHQVRALREAVLASGANASPIVTREYGCHEFQVTDPDGHLLVIGECG